jgi:hypothetical protein
MWSIHQHILLKWNCYTIFKYSMFNVPEMKRGFLQWFVPRGHPYTNTVKMWLEEELQSFAHTGSDQFPGTDVSVTIMEYDGIHSYLQREQAEAIAHNCLKRFMDDINNMKEDNNE